MIPSTMIIPSPSPALIQIGLNTQNHDQLITLQSFNAIKTIVRRPANPIPEDADADADAEFLIMLILMFILELCLCYNNCLYDLAIRNTDHWF